MRKTTGRSSVVTIAVSIVLRTCFTAGWAMEPLSNETMKTPGEDDTVRTLIRGLRSREQNLQTLQGMATAETHYGPEMLSAHQSIGDEGPLPEALKFSARGLHRIAFWLDFTGNRWRIEVAELLSTGRNEWGFLTNYGMREHKPLQPVLVETCDGSTVTHWDISLGRAKIRQFDASLLSGGGYVRGKLARSVLLGRARVRAAGYSLAGRDKVGEIDCYRLVQRVDGDQYYGKVALSIAPEMGFAPVRFVGLSVYADEPRRGSRTERIHTSFTQLADDIWFPRKTTTNRYSYVPEKDDAMCETSILRFSDLKANVPIPEFRFHTQLPPGVLVHETDLDKTTFIGHTQAVRGEFLGTPTAPSTTRYIAGGFGVMSLSLLTEAKGTLHTGPRTLSLANCRSSTIRLSVCFLISLRLVPALAQGCGVASVFDLTELVGQESGKDQAERILQAYPSEEASMLDVQQAADVLGIRLRGMTATFEELVSEVWGPKIVHLGDGGHFVVMARACPRWVQLLDGGRVLVVPREEIEKRYSGHALILEQTEEDTGAQAPIGRVLLSFRHHWSRAGS